MNRFRSGTICICVSWKMHGGHLMSHYLSLWVFGHGLAMLPGVRAVAVRIESGESNPTRTSTRGRRSGSPWWRGWIFSLKNVFFYKEISKIIYSARVSAGGGGGAHPRILPGWSWCRSWCRPTPKWKWNWKLMSEKGVGNVLTHCDGIFVDVWPVRRAGNGLKISATCVFSLSLTSARFFSRLTRRISQCSKIRVAIFEQFSRVSACCKCTALKMLFFRITCFSKIIDLDFFARSC